MRWFTINPLHYIYPIYQEKLKLRLLIDLYKEGNMWLSCSNFTYKRLRIEWSFKLTGREVKESLKWVSGFGWSCIHIDNILWEDLRMKSCILSTMALFRLRRLLARWVTDESYLNLLKFTLCSMFYSLSCFSALYLLSHIFLLGCKTLIFISLFNLLIFLTEDLLSTTTM